MPRPHAPFTKNQINLLSNIWCGSSSTCTMAALQKSRCRAQGKTHPVRLFCTAREACPCTVCSLYSAHPLRAHTPCRRFFFGHGIRPSALTAALGRHFFLNHIHPASIRALAVFMRRCVVSALWGYDFLRPCPAQRAHSAAAHCLHSSWGSSQAYASLTHFLCNEKQFRCQIPLSRCEGTVPAAHLPHFGADTKCRTLCC